MRVEATAFAGAFMKNETTAAEVIDRRRRGPEVAEDQPVQKKDKVAPEEILSKIKELTQGGMYSVQFEMNRDVNTLVVKVVDQETGELIRQIPPEELLDMAKALSEYRGLIVNTES